MDRSAGGSLLIAGDADEIHAFVFETSSLPQIRGGSELLLECERRVGSLVESSGGRILYCGGGAFLCEAPAEEAEKLAAALERIYPTTTGAATATVVTERAPSPAAAPAWPAPLDRWAERLRRAAAGLGPPGSFGARVAHLQARLRQAKLERRNTPFYEAWPIGRRCDGCRLRMATAEVPRREPGEGSEGAVEKLLLCPVCELRHRTGVQGGPGARGRFNREFAAWLAAEQGIPETHQPADLDELVAGTGRRHLAFLYADGNDIGALMAAAPDPEAYRRISEALRTATQEATFEALGRACTRELARGAAWPFEIVNIGGDDVTLLVRADLAWDVAVGFLERFEARARERLGPTLGPAGRAVTASCGIAIAPAAYPVRHLEKLAKRSLEAAKRRAKQGPVPESTIDFVWLRNASGIEDRDLVIAAYLRRQHCCALTSRPYTLAQARRLTDLARQAADWPGSQRQQWAQALEQGVLVSENAIRYSIALRSENDRARLTAFLAGVDGLFPAADGRIGPLWWQDTQTSGRRVWRTALLDVLELAELRGG